jgi:hypothetical protein
VERRQIFVSGCLAAFLLIAVSGVTQEPDCSQGEPPKGSVRVTGVQVGDRLVAGPAARIEIVDTAGEPAPWNITPIVDGQEGAWPTSWTAGEHTAGAVAVDACGRRATLPPVAFTVDTEPPALRWETGDLKTFVDKNRLSPDTEKDRRRRRLAKKDARPADDSWISLAGIWQVPLPWVSDPVLELKDPWEKLPPFHSRAQFSVPIKSEKPQAFLAAPDTLVSLDDADSTLGQRLLWIEAEDQGAGVENMTLCLHEEGKDCPAGTPLASTTSLLLRIKATDHVGNESQKEIVLRRGSQTASR